MFQSQKNQTKFMPVRLSRLLSTAIQLSKVVTLTTVSLFASEGIASLQSDAQSPSECESVLGKTEEQIINGISSLLPEKGQRIELAPDKDSYDASTLSHLGCELAEVTVQLEFTDDIAASFRNEIQTTIKALDGLYEDKAILAGRTSELKEEQRFLAALKKEHEHLKTFEEGRLSRANAKINAARANYEGNGRGYAEYINAYINAGIDSVSEHVASTYPKEFKEQYKAGLITTDAVYEAFDVGRFHSRLEHETDLPNPNGDNYQVNEAELRALMRQFNNRSAFHYVLPGIKYDYVLLKNGQNYRLSLRYEDGRNPWLYLNRDIHNKRHFNDVLAYLEEKAKRKILAFNLRSKLFRKMKVFLNSAVKVAGLELTISSAEDYLRNVYPTHEEKWVERLPDIDTEISELEHALAELETLITQHNELLTHIDSQLSPYEKLVIAFTRLQSDLLAHYHLLTDKSLVRQSHRQDTYSISNEIVTLHSTLSEYTSAIADSAVISIRYHGLGFRGEREFEFDTSEQAHQQWDSVISRLSAQFSGFELWEEVLTTTDETMHTKPGFSFKISALYGQEDLTATYPAKVQLRYRIGNSTPYPLADPITVYSDADKENAKKHLMTGLFELEPILHLEGLNAGRKVIFPGEEEVKTMVGGAIKLWEVDTDTYLGQWKVSNLGRLHSTTSAYYNPNKLERDMLLVVNNFADRIAVDTQTANVVEMGVDDTAFVNNEALGRISEQLSSGVSPAEIDFNKALYESINQVTLDPRQTIISATQTSARVASGYTKGYAKGVADSLEALKDMPQMALGMVEAFSEGMDASVELSGVIILSLWNDYVQTQESESLLQAALSIAETRGADVLNEIHALQRGLSELVENAATTLAVLDRLEPETKEHYSGFVLGYISAIASEGAAITYAVRNGSLVADKLVAGAAAFEQTMELLRTLTRVSVDVFQQQGFIMQPADVPVKYLNMADRAEYADEALSAILLRAKTVGNDGLVRQRAEKLNTYRAIDAEYTDVELVEFFKDHGYSINLHQIQVLRKVSILQKASFTKRYSSRHYLGEMIHHLRTGKPLTDFQRYTISRLEKTEVATVQYHHFFSPIHKDYSPRMQKQVEALGLDLEGSWNIQAVAGHLGRHSPAYHEMMNRELGRLLKQANGDRDQFLSSVKQLQLNVVKYPARYHFNIKQCELDACQPQSLILQEMFSY
ncbi:MAG: hypothetical protein GJ680_18605 [Alteromonadaceae bacterium]|nr:hypothetical protein [Alteromonadaceae bacterium]